MSPEQQTILLVEPNPELLEAAQELLTELGYRAIACRTAREALRFWDTEHPPIRLLVTDAYLDEMKGLELVDRLRRRAADLPAVLLSGFGDDPQLRRRVMAGSVGFLQVPFSSEELASSLREARTQSRQPAAAEATGSPDSELEPPVARGRTWSWAAAAAGLILASGLAIRTLAVAPPALPHEPGTGALRGLAIDAIAPRGELDTSPRRLAWIPTPEASTYRVRIQTIDDTVLWLDEVAESPATLPDTLIQTLQPAVTYLWSVEALAADRGRLAGSERTPFRIRPEAH